MHLTTILTGVLNDFRQPEYTGVNRCIPCTLLNLIMAIILAATVALVTSPIFGAGVFLLSVAAITVRGYLIPGTPALTKRYLPDTVLKLFDTSTHVTPQDRDRADATAPLEVLSKLGIVTDGVGGDLELDRGFARAWDEQLARQDVYALRLDDFAALFDLPVSDLTVSHHDDDACTVYLGSEWLGQWESAAAFNADIAAARILTGSFSEWNELPVALQSELLAALRVCLDVCPICRGSVELGTETIESCCRSIDVVASSCSDCGTRFFEAEVDFDLFGNSELEASV